MDVQQQQNGSDCGAFAVAFAKAILMGKDPTQLEFIDPRSHLALHLPEGSMYLAEFFSIIYLYNFDFGVLMKHST